MKLLKYTVITLVFISDISLANLSLENSWVRAAPMNSTKMSAYGLLKNNTMSSFNLIRIEASGFKNTQIHQSQINKEIMSMKELKNFTIEANSEIELTPGGKHIMLQFPMKIFKIGDSVELLLFFESSYEEKVIRVNAPIKREAP
ncbi:MAG: copper chaperone PCu(A)C [Gammaproteobacteria bacterium]|jgi:hypothetical protein|nr:copper chaperone PCu(A)C [Gammaproteobacteria bacterium]MDG2434320.1 copper chaperone PCu(A)C [Gammaproteobacteria bacterium]